MKLAKAFVHDIRELIVSARATVARGVDLVQVHTNFEIGRRIVEQEQKGKGRAAYGKAVIKALAERLTAEFGSGFSARNLAYTRTFYLRYQGRSRILQTVSAKLAGTRKLQSLSAKPSSDHKNQTPHPFTLSWSHYVFLLGIRNPDERSFYEIEAARQDWTVRELKRQFDSSLYERLALSRDKKGIRRLALDGQIISRPKDLLKEPLVLIDLKIGQVAHQDLGQMQMYVNYFDRHVRTRAEHATIGIVLCKKKNEALVEITLPRDANIHAREYQLYLPSKEELQHKMQEWAEELSDIKALL